MHWHPRAEYNCGTMFRGDYSQCKIWNTSMDRLLDRLHRGGWYKKHNGQRSQDRAATKVVKQRRGYRE